MVQALSHTAMHSQPLDTMRSGSSSATLSAHEPAEELRRDEDASLRMSDEGCLNETSVNPARRARIIPQSVTVDTMSTPRPNTIKTGTLMIEEGTLLPESLRWQSEPYSKRWRKVAQLDSHSFDRIARKVGWTYFFMAAELKETVFGFDRKQMLARAVRRLLAQVKSQRFNGMEITEMTANRFLGLPYLSVSAHARHIQNSLHLFQAKHGAEGNPAQCVAGAGA